MNRECPKCKKEMSVDSNKYVDVIVWVCKECGHEIFICNQ